MSNARKKRRNSQAAPAKKMNRGVKLAIMLAALAVIVVLAVVVSKQAGKADDDTAAQPDTVIMSIKKEAVKALSWTYEGTENAFELADDGWHWTGDETFPVERYYLNIMLNTLTSVKATKTIEDAADLSQYGLDAPAISVKVTDGDGVTSELHFGSKAEISGEYYCTTGDGKVYLTAAETADPFKYDVMGVIEKEILPEMTIVRSFKVTAPGREYTIEQEAGEGDEYAYYLSEGGSRILLDNTKAEALMAHVSGMEWGKCVTYTAEQADFDSCGLGADAVKVDMVYSAGSTNNSDGTIVTFPDTEITFIFGKADGVSYGCLPESDMIYTLGFDLDTLTGMDAAGLAADAA